MKKDSKEKDSEKEAFLRRCANIYDVGLADREILILLNTWVDAVMRFEGGQINTFVDFLLSERQRHGFYSHGTLANDHLGYKVIKFAAILAHPCQKCAEDPNAWWTRSAFCEHKDKAKSL